ncbi:MAG: carbon-nitrogen hydrolase [Acidobacteriota bacterium]|nr:carbon-nitrogen hydrolase [Acidobacteriota bacterium]
MKLALAQISPVLGRVDRNLEMHLELAERAAKEKAGLIIFPELSLTGYSLKDLVPEVAIRPEASEVLAKLQVASRQIDLIFGLVEERSDNPGVFYNSAAYLTGGKIAHVHRKVFLPTSGMFEEGRFFASGHDFRAFPLKSSQAGLLICRDFMHYSSSYCLLADGAGLMIIISAAPGRGTANEESQGFESSQKWELMGQAISYFSGAYVIYCNRVGIEDGATFAGGSFIYTPDGQLSLRLPYLEENFSLQEIDLDQIRRARKNRPYKRDDRPEVIWHSLGRLLRKENED